MSVTLIKRVNDEYAKQYKLITGTECNDVAVSINVQSEVQSVNGLTIIEELIEELTDLVTINERRREPVNMCWLNTLFIVYHEILRKKYNEITTNNIDTINDIYDSLFHNSKTKNKTKQTDNYYERNPVTDKTHTAEFLLLGVAPLNNAIVQTGTVMCKYNNTQDTVKYSEVFNDRELLLNKLGREMRQIEKQNRNIFNSVSVFTSPSLHKIDIPSDTLCKNEQCNDVIIPPKYSNIVIQYNKDKYIQLMHQREQLLQTPDDEPLATPLSGNCTPTMDIQILINNSKYNPETDFIDYNIKLQSDTNEFDNILGDKSLIAFKMFGLPLNSISVERIIKNATHHNAIMNHIDFYRTSKIKLSKIMNRDVLYPEVVSVLNAS
jgi:hypothetical protein